MDINPVYDGNVSREAPAVYDISETELEQFFAFQEVVYLPISRRIFEGHLAGKLPACRFGIRPDRYPPEALLVLVPKGELDPSNRDRSKQLKGNGAATETDPGAIAYRMAGNVRAALEARRHFLSQQKSLRARVRLAGEWMMANEAAWLLWAAGYLIRHGAERIATRMVSLALAIASPLLPGKETPADSQASF